MITNYLLNCVDILFTKYPSHVCIVCNVYIFTFVGNVVQISRENSVCEIIKYTRNKQFCQDMILNCIILYKHAHSM